MNPEHLKQILLEHNQRKMLSEPIPRECKKQIHIHKDDPSIIIITGIRRCGKSTLLNQLRSESEGYYVEFDDERLMDFEVKDFQLMYELLIEVCGEKEIFYFDEIQNIPGWERFVRRLHNEGKKVYITGSNARMLSTELGTRLTGRHIPFPLFPFSFNEFLQFKGKNIPQKTLLSEEKSGIKRLFNQYILHGGFPEYLQTDKTEYLKTLYDNIIYRDIVARYKLPHEKALKKVALFAASNIGKELSFNSLRKLTGLTSATTIREYFSYLENSFLCFLVQRYNPSLKKQIYSNKKAYFIDTGMAQILGFRSSHDAGRMLENVVYLQLLRHNQEIYFHKERYECDFVIRERGRITTAIQVTQRLNGNKEREIHGLKEAMNTYKLKKGLILTSDQEEQIEGNITVKPVWKWLLET